MWVTSGNEVAIEVERRMAPRFAMSFAAELASGDALVAVTVHDMSITGCGVEFLTRDPGGLEALGTSALLQLPSPDPVLPAASLPVVLLNTRQEGAGLRGGLAFGRLKTEQLRRLIGVIDAMMFR